MNLIERARTAHTRLSVDVASLKQELFASLGVADDAGFEKTLLSASLCPTTLDFLGTDGQDAAIGDILSGPGDLGQLDPVECVPFVARARESHGGSEGEDAQAGDGMELGGDDDDDCGAGCDDGALDLEEQMRQEIEEEQMPDGGAGVPLRTKSRARQSLTGDLDQLDMFIGVDDDYSYFSKEAARGWAGPAHWTFRKGAPKPLAALAPASDMHGDGGEVGEDVAVREFGTTYGKSKKGGKKKEAFFLDLTGPAPADMEKKMCKSKASTTLAAVKGSKEAESNTLPEDLRYSIDTLRRLFLRPRTRVTLRQSNYYRSSGMFGDDAGMGGDDDVLVAGKSQLRSAIRPGCCCLVPASLAHWRDKPVASPLPLLLGPRRPHPRAPGMLCLCSLARRGLIAWGAGWRLLCHGGCAR